MQRKGSDCPLDHYVRFPSHLHSFWDEDAGLDPVVGQKLNVAMQTSQPNILKFFYSSLRLPTELSASSTGFF